MTTAYSVLKTGLLLTARCALTLLCVAMMPARADGGAVCQLLSAGPGELAAGVTAIALPEADFCRASTPLGGGHAAHCAWGFDYRSDAATQAYAQLIGVVSACPTLLSGTRADPTVSHPDSYALRRFEGEDRSIYVSLKDKAALQRSFVFLRIEFSNPQ